MGGMTKGVSPLQETTGKLTATYLVYVSVENEGQIRAASAALEAPLRKAVEESHPGEAGCASVLQVTSMSPPAGSGHTGWAVMVTVGIDLTVWRRDLSLVDGRYASMTVRDLLADADLQEIDGLHLDQVETKVVAHAPA
jgi:hypothetical protein